MAAGGATKRADPCRIGPKQSGPPDAVSVVPSCRCLRRRGVRAVRFCARESPWGRASGRSSCQSLSVSASSCVIRSPSTSFSRKVSTLSESEVRANRSASGPEFDGRSSNQSLADVAWSEVRVSSSSSPCTYSSNLVLACSSRAVAKALSTSVRVFPSSSATRFSTVSLPPWCLPPRRSKSPPRCNTPPGPLPAAKTLPPTNPIDSNAI